MHDPTTPSAIAEKYDAIAYHALPCPVSHPDQMAAVVTMFGLHPPEVATARVLEIGCNDGSNLLPMAASLPQATFVGCDIAPRAIRAAGEAASELALANVTFVEADLAAHDGGPYDYIIAHGVYSWVGAPVRDALLALAGRALARNGILFASYNTYPGGYFRRAAWEALLWHTRGLDDRISMLRAAREIADLFGGAGPADDPSDAPLRNEFRRVAGETDSALFHDTLAEPNEPVWFHAFVEHAERHGLTYVAEAQPSMMAGGGLAPRVRRFLAAQDRLAREQYLDFARARRFRQSLLCRSELAADFQLSAGRFASLAVSASMQLMRAASESRYPTAAGTEGETLRRLLETLVEQAPAAMSVADLLSRVRDGQDARGARSDEAILLDSWVSGFAQLHAHAPRPAIRAPDRPRAAAIARWQAPRREDLTNLRHETIRLPDPAVRSLLALCDGTRDRAALARAVANGHDGADLALHAHMDETLAKFAQCALIERD